MVRLKERTGGFHKYVDSGFIHSPDPASNHYINGNSHFCWLTNHSDSDRFDRDFAVADQKVRNQQWEKTQDKYANLR